MADLEERDAQVLADHGVDALGAAVDEPVEGPAPAGDAVDDRGEQRAVAARERGAALRGEILLRGEIVARFGTEAQKARVEKIKKLSPTHIAPLAAFLASDAAKDITGQIFIAAGGFVASASGAALSFTVPAGVSGLEAKMPKSMGLAPAGGSVVR